MSTELLIALGLAASLAALLFFKLICNFGAQEFLFLLFALLPCFWLNRFAEIFVSFSESRATLLWGVLVFTTIVLLPFRSLPTAQLFRPVSRRLFATMAILVAILLLSTVVNMQEIPDLVRGVQACGFVVLVPLACWSVVRCIRPDEATLRRAIACLLLVGAVLAVMAIGTGFFPRFFAWLIEGAKTAEYESGRSFTPVGGANATAMCLLVFYCISLGCLFSSRKKFLSGICVLLAFVGLLTTQARAALVAFVICTLFLLFRYRFGLRKRIAILAIVGPCVLAPVAWRVAKDYSLSRFVSGLDASTYDPSVDLRLTSLKTALDVGTRHFVFGGGWGLLYPIHRLWTPLAQIPRVVYVEGEPSLAKPHSLFALVYAEGGGPAIIALFAYIWVLWSALRPPDARTEPYGHHVVQGFRAATLSFFLVSAVQDNLFIVDKVSIYFYMHAMLGLLLAQYYRYKASLTVAKRNAVVAASRHAGFVIPPRPAALVR